MYASVNICEEGGSSLLDWQTKAKCKGKSASVFYPQRGVPSASAVAMCRSCEVRVECLEYAISNNEEFGIWGGLSERERRKLQRDRSYRAQRKYLGLS